MPQTARPPLAIDGGPPASPSPVPFLSTALTQDDIDAALAVLRSGMLRQDRKCAELEERFARLSDARFARTCANGTCALQLAFAALLPKGCDVLVPAWTFIATASMVVAAGCRPVFCDVREDTFQIDPEDAARRITPDTRAIVATHLYGCPVDIDAIEQLAADHNLTVIYDAAQAHLATYKGRGIGAFGHAVTYSFYATKNLATGEGGLVTTNSPDTARSIELLRSHGETDKYLHETIGFNYRLNDIAAAIGCSRLDRLPEHTRIRRSNARRYNEILDDIPGLIPPAVTPHADPVWHLYTVKLDPDRFACSRDQFCQALRAEGVPTAVHYPRATSRQPAFTHLNPDHPPVADSLASRVFSLPMHHDLTDDHFNAIKAALHKVALAFRTHRP